MSGLPGLTARIEDGGLGFDYRMAMGIPDYWIKLIKEYKDEDWNPGDIFWELTNRRKEERTISYAESHDQALVGDQTIFFRLLDEKIYQHMMVDDDDLTVNRGMALHKMLRLITLATINGGYLNFMGNEFGHPEWIDFPREGNGWSYHYARRQWSLAGNLGLKYRYLNRFDTVMINLIKQEKNFPNNPITKLWDNSGDQVLAFARDHLVFVFNFNPSRSFVDYGMLVPPGKYVVVLNTDSLDFGGFGMNDDSLEHFTEFDPLYQYVDKGWLKLYIPVRTALVLRHIQ
jgi:1,4-alpha-glucan branching enzyme